MKTSTIAAIEERSQLTLALLGNGFIGWGGGIDFLRFCANALVQARGNEDIHVIIVLPDYEKKSILNKIKAAITPIKNKTRSIIGMNPIKKKEPEFSKKQLIDSFSNIDGSVKIKFYNPSAGINACLKTIDADVVIPSMYPLEEGCDLPWVGYLYDFQHKYFPNFFQPGIISKRDSQFAQMLAEAKAIIVNSISVKNDISKFYPETKCKIFSLPFAATPIESWFEPSGCVEKKYMLPKEYFVISNQFWIHKDHITAFKALAEFYSLTGRRDIHIVCTGKTEDFRYPEHFSTLKNETKKLGIENSIHYLGHIPKKDQIDILKGSIAVLQPTLFEGGPGGGAVYDAISIGTPAILSDIPVNMEIAHEERLYYFAVGNAASLASRMAEVVSSVTRRPEESELLKEGQERIALFGETLLQAARYVKDQWHASR